MKLLYLMGGLVAFLVMLGVFAVGFQGLADTQTENSTIWNETDDAQDLLTGFAEDSSAFVAIIVVLFALVFIFLAFKVASTFKGSFA